MWKRLVSGFVAALVMGTLVATPAWADFTPTPGAIFNRPNGTYEARYRLMTYVDHAIDNTRTGQTILISTYLLDRQTSVDKLIAARNRGVAVQVILDHLIATHQSARLMRALNADNDKPSPPDLTGADPRGGPDNSYAYQCRGSCRGGGGNMHTKFFAFSQTGTSQYVVMVSSANLNRGGATLGWNDLYTMAGRKAIFDRYAAIHAEMRDDTALDNDSYIAYQNGRYLSRFFPMKTASRYTDPTMKDLDKVHCQNASGGAGTYGRTAINVAMFRWGGTRGMYLARRLLELQTHGCVISIIYGAPSRDVAAVLKNAAHAGRIRLYDSRFDRNGDGYFDLRVHSKYMLISGHFGADTSSWQVFTGSQNWGFASLADGDELEINIAGHGAYTSYRNNWETIRTYGSRRIY